MRLRMLALGIFAVVSQTACSGSSSTPTTTPLGKLVIAACTADGGICPVDTVVHDGSTVQIQVTATDATGDAGTGTVLLTAAAGSINNKASDTVTLANGTATAIYACDSSLSSGCASSSTSVAGAWNDVKGVLRLTLSSPTVNSNDAGNADGGATDAGTTGDAGSSASTETTIKALSVAPASIASQSSTGTGLPTSAVVSFLVGAAAGAGTTPLEGVGVTFSAALGENLVTLSTTTAVSDSNGIVSVVATSLSTLGVAHVNATLPLGVGSATADVGIFGPPASVLEVAQLPLTGVLGIRGSGIQEQGLMTFLVTDAFGTPVPDAAINFTQNQPQLVSLNAGSGVTDATGLVSIAYSAGTEVGVTSITAAAMGTPAAGVHTVAVRGARPSASGFYFRCDHGSLPVYDVITNYSTMTCHVRLTDRNSNRVGIATPVNFATEAGSISASAMTTPFDPMNPESDAEGTVDVTFSTDTGNGSSPADVVPLEADTNVNQYPQRRTEAEPRMTVGGQVLNPRDQLVTIIAWTQGEEAFVDANHNGQFDPGELFYDEGDPYLDENDDNQYDQVVVGGQWEPRFCGTTASGACPAYQAPNGKWDSQTTIWAPTWVVFGGNIGVHSTPFGGTASTSEFSPTSCADYIDAPDNDHLHSPVISAPIYAYDQWGNTPTVGTTYAIETGSLSGALLTGTASVQLVGTTTEQEGFGAFGALLEGFDYGPVSALTGGPCTTANGTQCVYNLHFNSFDPALRGGVVVTNPTESSDITAANPDGGVPINVHYSACLPSQSGVLASPNPAEPFSFGVDVITPAGAGQVVGIGAYNGTLAAVTNSAN